MTREFTLLRLDLSAQSAGIYSTFEGRHEVIAVDRLLNEIVGAAT
jgi:hypothetical protein